MGSCPWVDDLEWVEYDGGAVQDRHRNASRIRMASAVTEIPEGAFARFFKLRVADLNNVTTISRNAFHGCRWLERVLTAASVAEICENAFCGCESLKEFDLSNVTKIGARAFYCCYALPRVNIPSVTTVGVFAFMNCFDLTDVKLGGGIQCIEEGAFNSCGCLVRIIIPSSVTEISSSAFFGCRDLVELQLNEGLQRIGARAFSCCISLRHVSIPSTTSKIGAYAFGKCDQLTSLELPEGLQIILEGACHSCPSLKSITIPSSTTLVDNKAFSNCFSLSEMTLREGVHCINFAAFRGCRSLTHKSIRIPLVALVIGVQDDSCQLLTTNTMRLPTRPDKKLIVSKWMQYRSPSQIEHAEAKVREILGRHQQTEEEKVRCIRKWFAYYYLLDVTTMLELAIWRADMNRSDQDAGARQESRRSCGKDMNVIIPGVAEYLEG